MPPTDAAALAEPLPGGQRSHHRAGRPRRRLLRWFLILDLCLVIAAIGTYRAVTGSEARLDATLKWLSEQVYSAVSGAIDGGYDRETARLIAETAEPILLRLAAHGGDTPSMAHRRGWINVLLSRSYDVIGDPARQIVFAKAGKRQFERAASIDPGNTEWHRNLAVVEDDIGNAMVAAGDLDGALRHHREGRRLVEVLLAADRDNPNLKGDLAASLGKLGRYYVERGWTRQGTSYLWQGRRLIRELVDEDPDNDRWRRYLRVFDRMIGEQMASAIPPAASRLPRL